MRITLSVIGGPHKGREFSFVGHESFVVGHQKPAFFSFSLTGPFPLVRINRTGRDGAHPGASRPG
jgi:hypothetical protein